MVMSRNRGLGLLAVIVLTLIGVSGWWWGREAPLGEGEQPVTVVATPTPEVAVVTMAVVGDVMLGRSVQEQMEKRGDFSWPFREMAEDLAKADVTVGNLEAVVVPGCSQAENRFIFCMRPEAREGLTLAGFDVLSQANNHAYNYGIKAYEESVSLLAAESMAVIDSERLVVKEIEGTTLGFLGFDDVSVPLDLARVRATVASASAKTEVTTVLVHWGVEYVDRPTVRQREVAQVLVEAGADIIAGSHPHWVQPMEYIGDTLVFWSLGNFVFDQMWSEQTRKGAVAWIEMSVQDRRLQKIDYEVVPVKIYEYGQPRDDLEMWQ